MRILFWLVCCSLLSCSEETVTIGQSEYTCVQWQTIGSQYSKETLIHIEITPVIVSVQGKEEPNVDLKTVTALINEKFNRCNMFFEMGEPVNVTIDTDHFSFIGQMNKNYQPGELRMMIMPKGVRFFEEYVKVIMGASLGIPTPENTSLGRPIFYVRAEKIYTDIVSHELAHVYGLDHTDTGNDTINKGHNCYTGDRIPGTTTPVNGLQIKLEDCTGVLPAGLKDVYTDEEVDNMIKNIMSNSPEECLVDFEIDQCHAMRKMIEINLSLQNVISKIEYGDKVYGEEI